MYEEVIADRIQIAVGSLDDPSRIKIDDHVWTKEQIQWFNIADHLPRFLASSTEVATKASQPGDA
jgi:hypothetical protein